jgi:nicotinamidase-related amidase
MLNRLLNAALAWYARRGLRAYHRYPADKTAVVFVDAQRAFVQPGTALAESLTLLVRLARARGFLVVHAPMAVVSGATFPTLAHREIERALSARADAPDIAPAAEPSSSDVTLPRRSTLSIFGHPEVDALIKSRGLEHLILAGPLGDLTLDSSLRDAVQRDLHVTVVSDCVAASSTAALELELRYTMPRYAHLVTGFEYLERLSRS